MPLDIRGTVFQRKVWEELRRIPRGETRTYREIARAIGAPRAVRAVGSACGANPVALVVPCHRAVRTDGGLGGYAWGLRARRSCSPWRSRRCARDDRRATSRRLVALAAIWGASFLFMRIAAPALGPFVDRRRCAC